MQVLHSPSDCAIEGSCVTIGNFDGVHRGHKALIVRTREKSRENNLSSVVVTFWPHPRHIVSPNKAHNPLSTRAMRRDRIEALDIDYLLEVPFTRELANLSPEEFVEHYLLPLHMRHLVTGYDFTLGRGRSGHTEELRAIGQKCGFSVEQLAPVRIGETIVSSTNLRALIAQGDIQNANILLGREYFLTGPVIRGARRGTGLGFPTANIEPPRILLPPKGVYVARAEIASQRFNALVNIGTNPTFGANALSVETHLLDAHIDCYGKTLALFFQDRVRDEKTFQSADELVEQIKNDRAYALSYFAKERERETIS
ncbi:MAG: bifunctional riboflavin kinase/FAD synthetase [Desulfovibrionaceae bacterium]|nr:bifunctional riboflavin kinase/FAD synthetase [Desulfovibrionaceae bacterium]